MTSNVESDGTPVTPDSISEGRQTSVEERNGNTPTGNRTSYVYDADGTRILKKIEGTGASTTHYVGNSEYTRAQGASSTKLVRNYSINDEPVATRTSAGLTTLVADHHNTAQLAIHDGPNTVKRRTTPFGDPLPPNTSAWPTDRGFLNKTTDTTTGTTHLDAREYDPKLGRFLTIDPILDTADPQQMNGYAYANNNPVTRADPSGLWVSGGSWTSHPGQMDWVSPDGRQRDPQAYNPVDPLGRPKPKAPEQKVERGNFKDAVGSVASILTSTADIITNAAQGRTPFSNSYQSYTTNWMVNWLDLNPHSYAWNLTDTTLMFLTLGTGSAAKVGTTARHGPSGTAAKTGARACSFAGATAVRMADGNKKPINKIQVGDKVIATDPKTGEQEAKAVEHVFVHNDTVTDLAVNGEVITTTDDHPFWSVTDQRFERADELSSGERVLGADGVVISVSGLSLGTTRETLAYNLSVEGIHTYHVGQNEILVHNTCDARGLWQIAKEGTAATKQGPFGTVSKSRSDGLWWSKDTAGHGGSAWKVYEESSRGLIWRSDANQYGDFIVGKHKSDIGTFIPWKDLN